MTPPRRDCDVTAVTSDRQSTSIERLPNQHVIARPRSVVTVHPMTAYELESVLDGRLICKEKKLPLLVRLSFKTRAKRNTAPQQSRYIDDIRYALPRIDLPDVRAEWAGQAAVVTKRIETVIRPIVYDPRIDVSLRMRRSARGPASNNQGSQPRSTQIRQTSLSRASSLPQNRRNALTYWASRRKTSREPLSVGFRGYWASWGGCPFGWRG